MIGPWRCTMNIKLNGTAEIIYSYTRSQVKFVVIHDEKDGRITDVQKDCAVLFEKMIAD